MCLFVFNLEIFLQGGQQYWALWAFLAACPCILFIDIISLFINWANKDACLLAYLAPASTSQITHGLT